MYQTIKHYIKPEMKLADILFENPSLLLILEHFNIDFVANEKSVGQICLENKINPDLFINFANLYNGFHNVEINLDIKDIETIIKFLRSSHHYYKNEKYPEIKELIELLIKKNDSKEIKLIEKFFDEYFEEVIEHLNYEEKIAFPYFCELIQSHKTNNTKNIFSVEEYKEHHTDIEFKLLELKNLLLRHIPIKNDRTLRRKLLKVLFEIDYDLTIHSKIEDEILIPLIRKIEKDSN